MFYVYKITNLINNKIYIGKTNNVEKRYKAHLRLAFSGKKTDSWCVKFYRSLIKYGSNNFSKPEILGTYNTEDESYEAEENFIKQYDSFKNGLNACPGGKSPFGKGPNSLYYIHKKSILKKRTDKKNDIEKNSVRYFKYVDKLNYNDCWIWIGGITSEYGTFRYKGKNTKSHIVSWLLHNKIDVVADGYYITHHCSNKLCVNPDHLFEINRKELNLRTFSHPDRVGSNRSNSKLDDDKVRDLRNLFYLGDKTVKELTIIYNINETTVRQIINRKKWKHVI